MQKPTATTSTPAVEEKENLKIPDAVAYLAKKGVQTSYRSLKRWIRLGMVTVGKVRGRTRWVTRASLDKLAEGE